MGCFVLFCFFLSNKLPCDLDDASLWTTLWVARLLEQSFWTWAWSCHFPTWNPSITPITSKVKSQILRWHTSVFIFSSLPIFPALSVTCVVSRTSQVPPHFGTGYRPHWPSRLPPTLLDSSQLLAPGVLICHLEVSVLPQCSPSTCCVLQLHIACLESFVYVSFSPLDCQFLWECQLYSLNLRLSIP